MSECISHVCSPWLLHVMLGIGAMPLVMGPTQHVSPVLSAMSTHTHRLGGYSSAAAAARDHQFVDPIQPTDTHRKKMLQHRLATNMNNPAMKGIQPTTFLDGSIMKCMSACTTSGNLEIAHPRHTGTIHASLCIRLCTIATIACMPRR